MGRCLRRIAKWMGRPVAVQARRVHAGGMNAAIDPQDDDRLARLRAEAADEAPQGLYRLAVALVDARRVEEAFDLHRRAAEAGFVPAQIEHARMLLYGVGAAAEPARAVEWLLRAEQAGNAVAGYYLATIALGGVVLPRDFAAINARMLAAMRAGHPLALRAVALQFGRRPHPQDQTLALQLLRRAADSGDALSAGLLAERLRLGEGRAPDPATAAALRRQLDAYGAPPLPEILADAPTEAPSGVAGTLAFERGLDEVAADVRSERPRVRTAEHVLSAEDCRMLVLQATPLLRQSQTVDPATGLPVEHAIRTSSDGSFDPLLEDFALRLLQLRMARAAGTELTQAEPLIVLRYLPGEEYRPHRDYLPPSRIESDRPQAGNRLRTICVYLNAVEAGGETEFAHTGLRIAPAPGRAVIFDNLLADGAPDPDTQHAGLPVIRGEKWLTTLWIRERRYRDY